MNMVKKPRNWSVNIANKIQELIQKFRERIKIQQSRYRTKRIYKFRTSIQSKYFVAYIKNQVHKPDVHMLCENTKNILLRHKCRSKKMQLKLRFHTASSCLGYMLNPNIRAFTPYCSIRFDITGLKPCVINYSLWHC